MCAQAKKIFFFVFYNNSKTGMSTEEETFTREAEYQDAYMGDSDENNLDEIVGLDEIVFSDDEDTIIMKKGSRKRRRVDKAFESESSKRAREDLLRFLGKMTATTSPEKQPSFFKDRDRDTNKQIPKPLSPPPTPIEEVIEVPPLKTTPEERKIRRASRFGDRVVEMGKLEIKHLIYGGRAASKAASQKIHELAIAKRI